MASNVVTLPGVILTEAVDAEHRLHRIQKLHIMLRRHARELAALTGEDVVITATLPVTAPEGVA